MGDLGTESPETPVSAGSAELADAVQTAGAGEVGEASATVESVPPQVWDAFRVEGDVAPLGIEWDFGLLVGGPAGQRADAPGSAAADAQTDTVAELADAPLFDDEGSADGADSTDSAGSADSAEGADGADGTDGADGAAHDHSEAEAADLGEELFTSGAVLAKVEDHARAAWSAKVRENLQVPGLRLVKPLRSTDGRAIVGGWKANIYQQGTRQARVDEVAMAALRLDDALAAIDVPSFAVDRVQTPWETKDMYLVADQAAWAQDPASILAPGLDLDATPSASMMWALTLAAQLQPELKQLEKLDVLLAVRQPCHADMLATTIFGAGDQPPVITDLVCVARPYGYTAALAIVDGLLAEAVDEGIIERFAHIPHRKQLLLRALLYRIFIHGLLPESVAATRAHIERVSRTLTAVER